MPEAKKIVYQAGASLSSFICSRLYDRRNCKNGFHSSPKRGIFFLGPAVCLPWHFEQKWPQWRAIRAANAQNWSWARWSFADWRFRCHTWACPLSPDWTRWTFQRLQQKCCRGTKLPQSIASVHHHNWAGNPGRGLWTSYFSLDSQSPDPEDLRWKKQRNFEIFYIMCFPSLSN